MVTQADEVRGILTDRDIVLRAVVDARDPSSGVGEFCSEELITVSASDLTASAAKLMRDHADHADHAVRRPPVVDEGRLVGIISIGDLAVELDESSALAEISDAPANV